MSAIKKTLDSIIHPESTQDKGKSMGDDGPGGIGPGGLTGGTANDYQSDSPKAQGNPGGALGDTAASSIGHNFRNEDEKGVTGGSNRPAKEYGMGATQ